MKNKILLIVTAIIVCFAFGLPAALTFAGLRDRFSHIELNGNPNSPGNYFFIPEMTTAPATPPSGYGVMYVIGNSIYYKDSSGTATGLN